MSQTTVVATIHCDVCDLRLYDYDGSLDPESIVTAGSLSNAEPRLGEPEHGQVVHCPACDNAFYFSVLPNDGSGKRIFIKRG